MSRKVSSREQDIKAITIQIRVSLARKEMTASDLANLLGKPKQTVCDWIRHPDKLDMHKWQQINAVLDLDPLPFIRAAGFVKGGVS